MSLFDQLKNRLQRRGAADGALPAGGAVAAGASDADVEALLSEIDQRLAAQSKPQGLDEVDLSAESPLAESSAMAPLDAQASRLADPDDLDTQAGAALPLIGAKPVAQQQRLLVALIGVGAVVFAVTAALALAAAGRQAKQLGTSGQALMQSQRLAKSVSQALVGSASAFPEVRESSQVLAMGVRGLAQGNEMVDSAGGEAGENVTALLPLIDRAEKNAGVVLGQQATLTQVGQALRTINRQSSDLLELAETVSSLKLQSGATPGELSAVGQLVMLTQRIGKSANEFLTLEGVSPEAVFLLGKDLNTFREVADGLLKGSAELRLPGTKDAATRERLEQLITQYEQTRAQAGSILGNLQGLVSAREAQAAIVGDSEKLRTGLEGVQSALEAQGGLGLGRIVLLVASMAAMLVGGLGLLRLYVREQGQRAVQAEQQRQAAEDQEREAKRVNDANQAAILRLMNELQSVAEGDLTQQATVTEDITGAIADSVNYTVEELRNLVAQVQGTTERVAQTTQQVESTSTELLAASTEQLREIRETGESVLQMATRINQVSAEAQETASVARQSLDRKSTRLNSSHSQQSRMPSSA